MSATPNNSAPRQRRIQPFDTFSPLMWHGKKAPGYDWVVENCFLRGTVAMLSGDGGLGKSLLMQQLCTASVIGAKWLGMNTKQCRSFAFFCEDDFDELHRRQEDINRYYDIDHADLDGVTYAARTGLENVLMEFDRRTDEAKPTPLFAQLEEAVLDSGAQIIVLDTLADVFAGNEIIRNQVRRFVSALRRLAIRVQGSVILTSHPSLTGLNSGTGISGSTAWNNSVRSRLYLTKPKHIEEGEDNDERLLKTMKNNQGATGGGLRIKWEKGVFVLVDGDPLANGMVSRLDHDQRVLEAARYLVERGTLLAADPSAKNGFATQVRNLRSCREMSFQAALSAQDRLEAAGKLVKVELGPPSKRRKYIRPVEMLFPGELGSKTPEGQML